MLDPAAAIALLGVAGLSPSAAILGLRIREANHWSNRLKPYRLQLPGDLKIEAVEQFLSGLSGLRAPGWSRYFSVRGLVFESVGTEEGIAHRLLIDPSQVGIVQTHLRGALPNVAAVPDDTYSVPTPSLAGELVTSSADHQLRIDAIAGTSSAILAALQPLNVGEAMVVQLVVLPVGSRMPEARPQWSESGKAQQPAPVSKSVREKYARPLFVVSARLGVRSASSIRDRQLLGRLTSAFHVANSPEAHLRRRRTSSAHSKRTLVSRRPPIFERPCHLNSAELAGLVAFPIGGVSLPGLHLGGCRQLAPASEIERSGRVVADSSLPGPLRPLALSEVDSLRHLHLIAPTGAGKTTLILNLVVQDMQAGRGVVVIDPKADLITDIIQRVPAHRLDDVIILDPTDDERPCGINLLAGGVEDRELVAEQILGTFHRLYQASWGPRSADILRAALLTVVGIPGMTLAEVPLILSDAAFRRELVGRLDDPIGLEPFWAWFEGLSESERAQAIGPVLNKLRSVLVRPRLRNVLGQADPRLDFDELLSSGRILLVPLSKGLLGEDAAALLGALVIARLWQAVQRRAQLAPDARRPVFCYIDEFQDYVALPTPIPDLMAQARSLKFGLTLAHQNLAQLNREVQEAVLANARSRVIWQPSASDATRLAREVAPHLSAQDLQGLGAHEVVVTLSTGGSVAPPATGRTRPEPPVCADGVAIREHSRQLYGRDRAEVEAEMRRRHDRPAGSGPVGRKRRSS